MRDIAGMYTNYTARLEKYIRDYDGKPVSFIVTGAGMSIANIATMPGSSKMLGELIIPYSSDSSKYFRDNSAEYYAAVSVNVTEEYYLESQYRWGERRPIVVVNGAVVTNRYRKGEDHAYIVVNNKVYHMSLPKLNEEEWKKQFDWDGCRSYRLLQDIIVSDFALQTLIYGIETWRATDIIEGLTLVEEKFTKIEGI